MNSYDKLAKSAKDAKESSRKLSLVSANKRNAALNKIADQLLKDADSIIKNNHKDILFCQEKKLPSSFIERLTLNHERIKEMSGSIREIARLKDPVGEVYEMLKRPNGLLIGKMRVPFGLIMIIYESRPNVTSDCAALCIKSGNAVILRGGSEAMNSNKAIFKSISDALGKTDLPNNIVNLVQTTDRGAVDILLGLNNFIDLVIPRGGESLIREIVNKSKIPVIKHYKGVCHVFVDRYANLSMAEEICFNAKVQRPGTCNAMETLLVDEKIAKKFLPSMIDRFTDAGVEIRGCRKTWSIVKNIKVAAEDDWYREYLDMILAVRVVKDIDESIEHITKYGSNHSDAIVTENYMNAMKFLAAVDSACVYVNASTRFTDGGQFGMGAEIGISTDKLHARGPMGLKELTTYKYIIFGNGQIRK